MKAAGKNRTDPARNAARSARKDPCAVEAIAWKALRNNRLEFKFRREHPVLEYRLDFYCAEALLAVEFDGEQHDPHRDAIRDSRLAELGIEVMRIPNREFFMLDGKISPNYFDEIRRRCEQRTGRKGIPFDWD